MLSVQNTVSELDFQNESSLKDLVEDIFTKMSERQEEIHNDSNNRPKDNNVSIQVTLVIYCKTTYCNKNQNKYNNLSVEIDILGFKYICIEIIT